jgi:hypothetical protein
MAVTIKYTVICGVTPCSFETARRFGGTYHGRRLNQTINQHKKAES